MCNHSVGLWRRLLPLFFLVIEPLKANLPYSFEILGQILQTFLAKGNACCRFIRQKKINPPCHFQRKEWFSISKLEYGFFAKSTVAGAFQRLRANLEMRLPNFFPGPAFAKAETRLPSALPDPLFRVAFTLDRPAGFFFTLAVNLGPRIDGVRKNGINMLLFWFRNA